MICTYAVNMGKRDLSSAVSPDCLWDGPSLQFKENRVFFAGSKATGVDLDQYHSPPLVPSLRMGRDISLYLYIYMPITLYLIIQPCFYIQGDSGGICNTLGNDSMCDSKQTSSYEHGSDFERLRSYDRLKLRIEGTDY
jgi:hypothetical protein